MFVSNLTPIIVIGGAAEVTPSQMLVMIQCAMIVSGISTLVHLYPIKIGKFQIGARLPIVMGTASTFIAPGVGVATAAVAAGHHNPIGLVIGGLMVASIAELVVGLTYKWISKLFPPLVIGATLIAIGLMLIPIGINNFAGLPMIAGEPNPNFGSATNLIIGFTVFFIGLFLQRFGKGIFKISSILIAIIVGYILAAFMGEFDVGGFGQSVLGAGWFQLPIPWYLRPTFELSAIASFVVIYIISGLSTIGYTNSITSGGFGRRATDQEVSAAIVHDAVSSSFATVFNCLPSTEFGQNAGMVAMTKIVNRWVFTLTAITLILAGFFPKIGEIFRAIPPPVLGGAILTVFAMILTNGMQLIAEDGFSPRNITVLCAVLGIGIGFGGNAAAIAGLPGWLQFIFNDRIVLVAILAILINLLFPRDKKAPEPIKAEASGPEVAKSDK
jgi:NCS2 family nucleobase:cation symporter-2